MSTALRRKRLPHAERREEILIAAATLFRAHGYDAASIDALATSVGITGPAIYRYFAGKSDILIALIERSVAQVIAALEPLARNSGAPDAIATMTDAMTEHALREGGVIALLRTGTAQMEAADRERLRRASRELLDTIGAALCRSRPDLSLGAARLHAEAALGVIGHIPADLAADPARLQRFRAILQAVLSA